jgi:hypothetical protein
LIGNPRSTAWVVLGGGAPVVVLCREEGRGTKELKVTAKSAIEPLLSKGLIPPSYDRF